ncbi:hypothetical protein DIPPA_18500 [Diplonema papillatum]|nr:hypothetical protein DIPPA_18500 [Diplonema papillatum]|eukprot:gene12303-19018_t
MACAHKYRRYAVVCVTVSLCASMLAGCLAMDRSERERPTAILVLGGDPEREVFAAYLAKRMSVDRIFVSSPAAGAEDRLGDALSRSTISFKAVDTVTNFSTMIPLLKAAGVKGVYLVTNKYHMRRATWCASVSLAFAGIEYVPVFVPPSYVPPERILVPDEPIVKVARDMLRSLLWCATGIDGTTFASYLRPERVHTQPDRIAPFSPAPAN